MKANFLFVTVSYVQLGQEKKMKDKICVAKYIFMNMHAPFLN